ncbi:exodeoxyribonuclease III, partial [Mycobacterium tuberculosis]|nr:exodeoxyribonuclease III [Mycobacterium tuberculosis]
GLEDPQIGFAGMPAYNDADEARAISATCGGVRVHSLYVPNGRELGHPHLDYKLEWYRALTSVVADRLAADPEEKLVLCGDFNVA